jgi:hypothetical protein
MKRADPNIILDFDEAAALTEELILLFHAEDVAFEAAMGGALTVMLQCLLRGTSDQVHALGILGSALSIAVASNMSADESIPNEEVLEFVLRGSSEEGPLH